jgi:hypothetical protein
MQLAIDRESPGRRTQCAAIGRVRPPMNHAGYVAPDEDELAPLQAPAVSTQPPLEEPRGVTGP